ncbi:hypothetical protein [Neorhizobium tomejilense]|uniref:hypothetical protein n=1 Tax=Neorhizobium tomejilense TaxID=2093828 RepID=UPI00155F29DB|nr:hypothetical protein [Neorhizobium tomejilense]
MLPLLIMERTNASAILDSFSAHGRMLTAKRPHRLYKDILRIGFTAAFKEHDLSLYGLDSLGGVGAECIFWLFHSVNSARIEAGLNRTDG